jgi:hypothetical protein
MVAGRGDAVVMPDSNHPIPIKRDRHQRRLVMRRVPRWRERRQLGTTRFRAPRARSTPRSLVREPRSQGQYHERGCLATPSWDGGIEGSQVLDIAALKKRFAFSPDVPRRAVLPSPPTPDPAPIAPPLRDIGLLGPLRQLGHERRQLDYRFGNRTQDPLPACVVVDCVKITDRPRPRVEDCRQSTLETTESGIAPTGGAWHAGNAPGFRRSMESAEQLDTVEGNLAGRGVTG